MFRYDGSLYPKMKILLIVLSERSQADALRIVKSKYPEGIITCFTKAELGSKSLPDLIKILRSDKYSCSIIFSNNLAYQTKIIFLKTILLISRADRKKIVDCNSEELNTGLWDFIKSLPLFILETVITIACLAGLFLILNIFLLYLKLFPYNKRKYSNKNSRQVVFLRSDYAFGVKTGGMSTYYKGFSRGIQDWGYNVLFISNDDLDITDAPVQVIHLRKLFNSFPDTPQLLYNFTCFWQAYKILRRNPPTLIFQISDPYNFVGGLLARLLKVPFFYNCHYIDIYNLYLNDKIYLAYYSKLIERVSIMSSDVIFTVSGVLKDILLQRGAPQKIIIKPMAVDPDLFQPQVKGSQDVRNLYHLSGKIVVGYTGSFFLHHGLEVTIQAAKIVSSRNPGVHFLLVGDGVCFAGIKQLIEQENLTETVTLTGSVSLAQMPAYLDVCHICIAPYTQLEKGLEFFGTPSKVFEYMAMERGIIASDLRPVREVVDDNKEGLLIEPGNPDILAEAILRLARDQELRIKLGKQARKRAVEKYTWKAVEGMVIKAYEDLSNKP